MHTCPRRTSGSSTSSGGGGSSSTGSTGSGGESGAASTNVVSPRGRTGCAGGTCGSFAASRATSSRRRRGSCESHGVAVDPGRERRRVDREEEVVLARHEREVLGLEGLLTDAEQARRVDFPAAHRLEVL